MLGSAHHPTPEAPAGPPLAPLSQRKPGQPARPPLQVHERSVESDLVLACVREFMRDNRRVGGWGVGG